MKKIKKLLFLGTLGIVAVPAIAFSLVAQGLENPKEITGETNYGIGVDPNDGDDHSSVIANITINEDKTITININSPEGGIIDSDEFSNQIKHGFRNSKGEIYEIKEIIIGESVKFPNDSEYLFSEFNNADLHDVGDFEIKIPDGIEKHAKDVTNASSMFSWRNLKGLNFSKWDMSKITNTSSMFEGVKNANIDLSNSNLNIDTLDKDNLEWMFSNTSGQVTLTGKMTKDLFSKFDDNSELMIMGPDENPPKYAIFDEDGYAVGYLKENTPDQDLIDSLDDTTKYTFKEAPEPNELINEYEHLNEIQKFNLKSEYFQNSEDIAKINELIKKANELDKAMDKLQKANENRLQTFVTSSDKNKYTDAFNKKVEELNKKVQKALKTENTTKDGDDGVDSLIKQIEDLNPEFKAPITPPDPETKDLDESKENAKNKIDDLTNLNKDQVKAAKDKINNSSKNSDVNKAVEEAKKLNEEMKDVNKQIKELVENKNNTENYNSKIDTLISKGPNVLTSYKDIAIIHINKLNYLNQAQKQALKNNIKSKTDAKEISKLIDKANNLNSTMKQLNKVNSDTLLEFVKNKNILSEDLKNTVENLSTEIKSIISKNNDSTEVNKDQEYVQKLIDQVNSLVSKYKQNAKNNIDSLEYLNNAQKDDLKNKISRNLKPSEINEIVTDSVNLDSKMQKLNEANENTLSEFANDSKNLPEDLKNKVNVLNNKVRSLITKNNDSAEANKNQEYVGQLIDEINSLINQYKESLNSELNSPKYKYLNDSQKEDLKNQLNNVNTKKDLDAIASKTTRLNDKMKQLSVATVTDLQKIVETKRFNKLTLEAKVIKNKIIIHLPTNKSSQGKNISEQEIDGYLQDIKNLKARYLTPGIGNIKDITKGKKYYTGLITANIIATVITLIATTVIIKRYKHRKQK